MESVSSQSYKNWECIVINDGSTDETEDVAREFCINDSRFIYLKTKNSGLSASRNTGIKMSRGKYIQLLDADDLIEPEKIKESLEIYQSDHISKTDAIVYSSMRYFEDHAADHYKILGRQNFPAHIELKISDTLTTQTELIRIRNLCVISAPLYPRILFDKIGTFDENLTSLEDWDFHLRCLAGKYKFHHYYALNGLTLIRLHNSSMMRNQALLDLNYSKVLAKHNLASASGDIKLDNRPSLKTRILRRIRKNMATWTVSGKIFSRRNKA
jgi:glycosyltransferase involved in cell wall biosynthesis